MEAWAIVLISILVLVSVGIGIYLLTKKNEKKEEKKKEETVEKAQVDIAMMQGNCEKGGNVENANKPYDISKGQDVTTVLQAEIDSNPIDDAITAAWWTTNEVCPGTNVFKQLVIKPKGIDEPIRYAPTNQVDTTISAWRKPETQ